MDDDAVRDPSAEPGRDAFRADCKSACGPFRFIGVPGVSDGLGVLGPASAFSCKICVDQEYDEQRCQVCVPNVMYLHG